MRVQVEIAASDPEGRVGQLVIDCEVEWLEPSLENVGAMKTFSPARLYRVEIHHPSGSIIQWIK